MCEVAVLKYVVCRLIKRKSLSWYPRSVIKYEIWKIFLRPIRLRRFLRRTLRVNKPALKKFLKNLAFGVDVKL